MSDPQPAAEPAPLPEQRFTLNASPPVRPLAIGAGAVVVGAALLVLGRGSDLALVTVVAGVVLMLAGIALAVAALVLTARLRTEVSIDADALTAVRGGKRRSVTWAEVSRVQSAHPRLSLTAEDPAKSVSLVNPRAEDDPRFAALLGAIQQRLDDSRGYRRLS